MVSESSLTCEHYFSEITTSWGKRAFSDKLLVELTKSSCFHLPDSGILQAGYQCLPLFMFGHKLIQLNFCV
jgi:hypothetical protein